jgi:succinoglycan biosynthesis protein ExoV
MKLYYYRGGKPNFGDDLNSWMWPRLMPGVWDNNENVIFLGIGSILFDNFPKNSKKIVFGAGYGGYTPLPVIDENWKFYFVRGKHTAKSLNMDSALGIGDSAILLRSCIEKRPAMQHRVSFMPHWESTVDGAWVEACKLASINYIDPTGSVEYILDEILGTELLITEAMHGAIVSDALRVPWVAVRPIQERHHMKWFDWASALDLTLKPYPLGASTFVESAMKWAEPNQALVRNIRSQRRLLRCIFPSVFAERAAEQLRAISQVNPSLSRDSMIETAHQQMLEKMDLLLDDLRS